MTNQKAKHFYSLDAFRGILALAVVIFHIRIYNSITEITFFRNSHVFVSFFFVLSGFVMTHSCKKKHISFKHFACSRLIRLYPLHIIMLFFFITFEIGKYIAYEKFNIQFSNSPFSGVTATNQILPNILLLQSWIPFAEHLSFNYPSWSISIEIYMYLVFFIIIKSKHRDILLLSIFTIMICIELSEATLITHEASHGIACFLGGSVTYYIYSKKKWVIKSILISTIVEIFTLTTIIYIVSTDIHNRDKYLVGFFMFSIFIFSLEGGCISFMLKHKIFQFVGTISYSLYMTHAATIFIFTFITLIIAKRTSIFATESIKGARFFLFGPAWTANIVLILLLLTSIGISTCSYFLIEKKTRKFQLFKGNRQ